MKTLVGLIVELDHIFDERSKDSMEPVYVRVDDRLVALADDDVVCEYNREIGKRIVILKGVTQ